MAEAQRKSMFRPSKLCTAYPNYIRELAMFSLRATGLMFFINTMEGTWVKMRQLLGHNPSWFPRDPMCLSTIRQEGEFPPSRKKLLKDSTLNEIYMIKKAKSIKISRWSMWQAKKWELNDSNWHNYFMYSAHRSADAMQHALFQVLSMD